MTASPTRRILGLDPGLRVTGFGIIDVSGSRLSYVTSGSIRTEGEGLPTRLGIIAHDLTHIIREFRPNEASVELVFVNVNPTSTLLLGQARGCAVTALVMAGLPVYEYTANQIKQAVVGHGKAQKTQVQHMVQRLLQLPSAPSSDAADALACAICHINSASSISRLPTPRHRRGGRIIG
ncbi:MAG: crossover junction endodeoxyribonuclease RuvC [Burkholderiales bacterium]|jgi:crossover junction endodeoxyribonuclease RuvC|nr:crossover junction endodeoxyribonuclease RuvC [Burkholderiales bacterium]